MPAPSVRSASLESSARRFAESTRHQHFDAELTRARERWQSKPALGECAVLKEKSDLSLCQTASRALSALGAEPLATPERALSLLEDAALSLARLAERVRFLSLAELSDKRRSKAAAPKPSASAARPVSSHDFHGVPPEAPGAFQLSDGPLAQMTEASVRLERDALRNIGAYLEYAELAERHSALGTVKGLRGVHPEWPQLDHLLHEAWLLETDSKLKSELAELVDAEAASAQSPASK